MIYKIICSWCNQYIGEKKVSGSIGQAGNISHGICPHCEGKVRKEIIAMKTKKVTGEGGSR